jgi:hypothetical protein
VAWNQTKQNVLRDLLQERVQVEQYASTYDEWGLTRSWISIINSYVTDTIKQNILNDLIDDKVAYLQSQQNVKSAEITALQDTITQGLSLKE